MNEQELRHALRGAMAATAQPPSMNGAEVLDAAQRSRRRRRATLAGLASAAAVIVIAAGAMIVAASGGIDTPSSGVGARPAVTETAPPPPSNPTETQWPDGQTDRTARQGPRYEQGAKLLDLLTMSVPPGLESPTDLKPADGSSWSGELRQHQAQFADEVNGTQIWEYMAYLPVGANGKWGQLMAEVHSAGNTIVAEGCALARSFWGMTGQCQLVDVNGAKVGVVVAPTAGDDRYDQWAAYRHPDGTVVFIAQAKSYRMAGLPALAEPPLTVPQLAELAADPKFHLG